MIDFSVCLKVANLAPRPNAMQSSRDGKIHRAKLQLELHRRIETLLLEGFPTWPGSVPSWLAYWYDMCLTSVREPLKYTRPGCLACSFCDTRDSLCYCAQTTDFLQGTILAGHASAPSSRVTTYHAFGESSCSSLNQLTARDYSGADAHAMVACGMYRFRARRAAWLSPTLALPQPGRGGGFGSAMGLLGLRERADGV